jgi:hypothetical protein
MEDIDDENLIFRDACKKGKTISDKVWKASDYLEDLMDNYQKEFQKNPLPIEKDTSVAAILNKKGWKAETRIQKAAEWYIFDYEYCGQLDNTSVVHNVQEEWNDIDFNLETFFVQDERGYAVIMEDMIKEVGEENIKLN